MSSSGVSPEFASTLKSPTTAEEIPPSSPNEQNPRTRQMLLPKVRGLSFCYARDPESICAPWTRSSVYVLDYFPPHTATCQLFRLFEFPRLPLWSLHLGQGLLVDHLEHVPLRLMLPVQLAFDSLGLPTPITLGGLGRRVCGLGLSPHRLLQQFRQIRDFREFL